MPFEKQESIVLAGRRGMPASASLTQRKGGRPQLNIGLTLAFTTEAKLKPTDRFHLLVGTGDDRGTLRLQRAPDGLLIPRFMKGSARFNCGHVERYGVEGAEKEFCNASVIEPGTIEVKLPPWDDDVAD